MIPIPAYNLTMIWLNHKIKLALGYVLILFRVLPNFDWCHSLLQIRQNSSLLIPVDWTQPPSNLFRWQMPQ